MKSTQELRTQADESADKVINDLVALLALLPGDPKTKEELVKSFVENMRALALLDNLTMVTQARENVLGPGGKL